MNLNFKSNNDFTPIVEHVKNTANQVVCSGAATFVIHKDTVVIEEYWGKQSNKNDARTVQANTQFHVASVRKSYIGFAVAYAIFTGKIQSIDDHVLQYLPELDTEIWENTTIRHLLTHTHGLNELDGQIFREYPVGENWTYRQVNINTLTELVNRTTQKTVSHILHEQVFEPLGLKETGWYSNSHEKLVDVILTDGQHRKWNIDKSTDGDRMNMFVSARELAFWGYLHLKEGNINGKQIVPKELLNLAISLQSPSTIDKDLPQNGFLWFVKALPATKTEIGASVPKGAFQILGYTGVTLLVIPDEDIVAVRMFNSYGSPEGYDYLEDVRSFGDTVMDCLKKLEIENVQNRTLSL
ncbi:serine hydrolase domain-containing protein [Ureibacillus chungkukjangi]|uniref:CubicO group peptidase (Beta-lactamase class C family) n=1 Tax=Ureibacillus chungkukjangi TaxID=1202712 RepID=A0A318TLH9_9BACL|nr:serine hydrolase domain-containing protein [Ureibacillus chungkukjangi]MCM3387823.1 beta-lactamase family protein [Ureibacillus chungkukjangi]PYF05702.1 CubicO group peptidase (beta-lactamase class C family) [Ureibacillus chungkukjangi]